MDNGTTLFLLSVLEENWLHARLSEEKRAILAQFVIIIASIVQMILSYQGFSPRMLLLTLLLVVLSLYALIVNLKLYERAQFHTLRARKVRAHLNELCYNTQVEELYNSAEEEHAKRYQFWMRIRLNNIWLALYLLVMMVGFVETIFCLL